MLIDLRNRFAIQFLGPLWWQSPQEAREDWGEWSEENPQGSPTGCLMLRNGMLFIHFFNAIKCLLRWLSHYIIIIFIIPSVFSSQSLIKLSIKHTAWQQASTLHQGRRARNALNSTRRISEICQFVEKVCRHSNSGYQYKTTGLTNPEEEKTCTQQRNFCARPRCNCAKYSSCVPMILQKTDS